jgi:hypothetical protein
MVGFGRVSVGRSVGDKFHSFVKRAIFIGNSTGLAASWHRIGTERPSQHIVGLFGGLVVFAAEQVRVSVKRDTRPSVTSAGRNDMHRLAALE